MHWNSGIWWWGHCLWCKKVKPEDAVDAVCSGIVVYGGGDIVFGAKGSNQWMQYTVDAVHSMQWTQYTVDAVRSGRSGIVVYGDGDIVFGAKRSNQRMQWNSGIWWWGHCLGYSGYSDTVDAVCSGCSTQWTQYAVE